MKINYNLPLVRVARRVIVVAGGAALVVFLGKIDLAPDKLIDSTLALSWADWRTIIMTGAGTGILLGLDKLKRELGI